MACFGGAISMLALGPLAERFALTCIFSATRKLPACPPMTCCDVSAREQTRDALPGPSAHSGSLYTSSANDGREDSFAVACRSKSFRWRILLSGLVLHGPDARARRGVQVARRGQAEHTASFSESQGPSEKYVAALNVDSVSAILGSKTSQATNALEGHAAEIVMLYIA